MSRPQDHLGRPAVLEVRNLRVAFRNDPPVVDGVDLTISAGRLLCLVGESGSGKSATALALMRLLPPDARISADRLHLFGRDLQAASSSDLTALRGDRIAIVFQDSSLSLNPFMTIGDQIAEALLAHRPVGRSAAREAALAMLDCIRMPGGAERLALFAHQLSGGMRQRALIAMALICRPDLLIADEPTSSLDALVQRQVIRLISNLHQEFGAAVLLITHDLMLVQDVADDIVVMFAGQIVERGLRSEVLDDPLHPYTLALLAALADDEGGHDGTRRADPEPAEHRPGIDGCGFHTRCPVAMDRCRRERPVLVAFGATHSVACWRAPLEATLR